MPAGLSKLSSADNPPAARATAAAAAAATGMQQQAVALLTWLQPLLKVARIRSMACDIVLLPPEHLVAAPQHQQQQQQGYAGNLQQQQQQQWGFGQPSHPPAQQQPQQQGSYWQQQQQQAFAQAQLWSVAQTLARQLAPADPTFICRAAHQQGCLLRRLLLLLPTMAPCSHDPKGQLLTEAVTLLLLMLYDGQFKYDTTTHLLDCYSWLLQLVGSAREDAVADALSAALDRLTVQLFNSEEVRPVTFGM
jgi:hypothetical protein